MTLSTVEKGHDRCLIEFWLYQLAAPYASFQKLFSKLAICYRRRLLSLGTIHPPKRGLKCLQASAVSIAYQLSLIFRPHG